MTLTVNGVEVEHLAAARDWVTEHDPPDVIIRLTGTSTFPWGVTWVHPAPVTIRGSKAVFAGDGGSSFWLGWKSPATLTVVNVTVDSYERGGIDADGGHVTVRASQFRRIGSTACDDTRAGYAAIYTRSPLDVVDTTFRGCANTCTDTRCRHWALMHACYAVGPRARANVASCRFLGVSGDPVRVRNGAVATVAGCTTKTAGERALASSWHAAGEKPGVAVVAGNNRIGPGWRNNKIVPWGPDPKVA